MRKKWHRWDAGHLWVINSPFSGWMIYTARPYRREALERFTLNHLKVHGWNWYYKRGWRCVRVKFETELRR